MKNFKNKNYMLPWLLTAINTEVLDTIIIKPKLNIFLNIKNTQKLLKLENFSLKMKTQNIKII